VRCSNAVSIVVDGGLTETRPGDTVFVCSGVDGYLAASQRTISWLRDQARHGRTMGGVCTGAFTLARAGLLQDRRFTLHWENQPAFEEIFPDLPITSQLFCRDGNIITCGGGNAGIDLFVSLIEEHHGTGLATKVAEMCLHGIPRGESNKQRLSIAAELGVRHPKLSAILNDMRAGFAEDLDIEELAEKHGLSRRQMERLFHDRLKTSPAAKLRDIRVDQAHSLISETDMSMMEIAVACGFQSQAALRKAYRQRFGVVPSFKMRQQPRKT
jgi:transcriptional regulator GlxA family with amidase domain